MKLIPKRIPRSSVVLIVLFSWFCGWQYHGLWTRIYGYLDANVWRPYVWLWRPLIILSFVGIFAFLIAVLIKFSYDLKKLEKDEMETNKDKIGVLFDKDTMVVNLFTEVAESERIAKGVFSSLTANRDFKELLANADAIIGLAKEYQYTYDDQDAIQIQSWWSINIECVTAERTQFKAFGDDLLTILGILGIPFELQAE